MKLNETYLEQTKTYFIPTRKKIKQLKDEVLFSLHKLFFNTYLTNTTMMKSQNYHL